MKPLHNHTAGSISRSAARQHGLSLVEILVGLAIALFLLGGLFSLFQATNQTFRAQDQLASLQDNERLAMTLLTNAVQSAGFFPIPDAAGNIVAATSALGATTTAPIFAAGQGLTATHSATAPGDSLTARYIGDGATTNCVGGTTASGTQAVGQFSVNAQNELTCALNGGSPQPLVKGVSNLQALFGVATTNAGSADEYFTANNVANWGNVVSVRITLTFVNPLAGQPGQPATIDFTRVIPVMNKL